MRVAMLIALALAVPAAAVSAATHPPRPCSLVPLKTISADMGAPAKAYPERAHDGVTLCLYISSKGRAQVEDGSRSNFAKADPKSSPPGTVIRNEPSLGENGALVYNKKKKYRFADAAFEHGPFYYAVYSNLITPPKVLALAKLVHKKVVG